MASLLLQKDLGRRGDPEKGYNNYRYDTFPSPPLKRESSPSPAPPHKMTKTIIVRLIVAATLLLGCVSAFPLEWLVGRQLSTPPPADFRDNHVPQNITSYDAENWVLSTDTFLPNHYQTQPYVANGYHGSRVPAEGIGFWISRNGSNPSGAAPVNGWPLDNPRQTVATISGFWDSQRNTTRTNFPELLEGGGESVISGIPTWSALYVSTPDGVHTYTPGVDPATITNFHQALSIRNGILTTSLTWTPTPEHSYNLTFTLLAHRSRINLGMLKATITPNTNSDILVTDILDGAGAQRTHHAAKSFTSADNAIWTSVHPWGLAVTAYEYSTLSLGASSACLLHHQSAEGRPYVSSNASTISQEFLLSGKRTVPITIEKFVGISSTDAFPNDTMVVAVRAAMDAKQVGWEALIEEHAAAWDDLWEDADIIIHGDPELQIATRATLFHLLSNVRGGSEGPGLGDNSIAVGGLASDSYAGLVFWDADLWMLPGLLALHPDHAAAINNYRFKLLPAAMENAAEYGSPGAMYPWTSSRFGNCTGTGPCADYQYHLNTDIALVHWHQFLSTGDYGWLREQGWPIINAVAEMWAARVVKSEENGEDGLQEGMFMVLNMTDPDEYANHVDNGAFTNAGVKVIMGVAKAAARLLGVEPPQKWSEVEENIFIPYNVNASIIPEYGTMNGSVEIKQADVVLINYPLEFRLNESQALNDLDFYARAQSPDGPAMTWAMFAISAADLSPAGCASYTYTVYASQPYLREPYYQFSEQMNDDIYSNGNTNPAFTFLTGHGGFLQISTHGFTGYRPRLDAFYLDPTLPPQLEGIEVKGMKHQGAVYNVAINLTSTTITRVPPRKSLLARRTGANTTTTDTAPATIRIADRNPLGGDHILHIGQSLTVPTRRPDLNGTDLPGNLAQCKPATSTSTYVAGQFPLAAVDGSNHTVWQPSTTAPSALTVDLQERTKINGVSFNWARFPPNAWTVLVHDGDGGHEQEEGWTRVAGSTSVEVSEPWSEDESLVVTRHIGNITVQMLESEVEARWVRLVIEGSKAGVGVGATVAQFGLL